MIYVFRMQVNPRGVYPSNKKNGKNPPHSVNPLHKKRFNEIKKWCSGSQTNRTQIETNSIKIALKKCGSAGITDPMRFVRMDFNWGVCLLATITLIYVKYNNKPSNT